MSVKYEYNIIGDKLYGNACYGMKRCLYKGTYGTPSLRMRHIRKINFARIILVFERVLAMNLFFLIVEDLHLYACMV